MKDKVKELISALFDSCALLGKIDDAAIERLKAGVRFARAVPR